MSSARLKLAQVIYELGKHEESVRLLTEIDREKPGEPPVWWLLARNESRRGRPKEAIPWLERYTAALPRNPNGWAYLGRARSDLGDFAASEKDYRTGLSLEPNLTIGWLWLGQLLVATGRKPEAEQALANFRKLKALDDEVKRCLRDLLRHPDDADVLMRLAQARTQLGQYRDAMVPLRRLLELKPGDPQLIQARDELIRAIERVRKQENAGKQADEGSAPNR
jgi:predicted Zn-dependent protease